MQGVGELGNGDWRGISRKFVFYRSPTQVASQAHKFYKRLHDNDYLKKKRSIHDITGVGVAGITEPSQGQKSDELTGPCGGLLQWPITDYVTDAFDTGILSVPCPVTNCTTDATEGPSAFNPEKSPLDAALVSELSSSFPGVDEFLQSVEDLITVPAEGTSGVCRGVGTRISQSLNLQPSVVAGTGKYIHPVSVLAEGSGVRRGVDTSTAPSFNLQPSVGGGPGTYTHPVNNIGYDLEELMTKQLIVASQVGPTVNTASLQLPITDHTGFHGCTASSSGTKNDFASTKGAPEGVFSVNTMQFP